MYWIIGIILASLGTMATFKEGYIFWIAVTVGILTAIAALLHVLAYCKDWQHRHQN